MRLTNENRKKKIEGGAFYKKTRPSVNNSFLHRIIDSK
jgi:hypothetical protein